MIWEVIFFSKLWATFILFSSAYQDEYEELGILPRKDYSLLAPFQGNNLVMSHWDFFGSTIVAPKFIRLTPDQPSRVGGLWNSKPLKFPNWEIHFQAQIHGRASKFSGDGMAFWYLSEPMLPGPVFGSSDYFNGLGIFFDTYANCHSSHVHKHPYISVMINNGSIHYDHDHDGQGSMLAGCEALSLVNYASQNSFSIRYDNDELTMRVDIENKNEWQDCFRLQGIRLPTNGYIGFSASTGELSNYHDLLMIKIYELEIKPNQITKDRDKIVPQSLHQKPGSMVSDSKSQLSNLHLFLIIFFSVISFIFLFVLFYLYWEVKNEKHRKRFY